MKEFAIAGCHTLALAFVVYCRTVCQCIVMLCVNVLKCLLYIATLWSAGQWRQDPRLPDLGLRGLFDVQQLPPPPAEAGGTSSRKQRAAGMSVVGEDAHRRWRYQLGIAEGDQEIPSGGV